MDESRLLEIVEEQSRIYPDGIPPLFVIDHDQIRENYRTFRKHLPRVQAYYAVKANSDPEIVRTLFNEGASFDVASWNEFMLVYRLVEGWDEKRRKDFIWDKVIYAHPVKQVQTLKQLRPYKPLVSYDSEVELLKIKEHCNTAGLVLRVKVPDTGSMAEQGSKFGVEPADALVLIERAFSMGLVVEGISFHVGSQCTNFDNYVDAINIAAEIIEDAERSGVRKFRLLDLGGGFPAQYDTPAPDFGKLAKIINAELERIFGKRLEDKAFEIIAEPGRFIIANAASLVTRIIGKARRGGKIFYYINDGIYGTFSGKVFDHCNYHFDPLPSSKGGQREVCTVAGQTCDSFDKVSESEYLPTDLGTKDYLLTRNIGAYSIVSASDFNGLERAKVIHVSL
jgi:ornithine decarboxylase